MRIEGRQWQDAMRRLLDEPSEASLTAQSIIWHLNRIVHVVEKRLEYDIHRPLGWTWPAFRIMSQLYILGPQEPSQLAEGLQLTRPTITVGVDRLVRDGYATREVQAKNKSRVSVELTEAGKAAVEKASMLQHDKERDLVSALTLEEQKQFAELLRKMFDSL